MGINWNRNPLKLFGGLSALIISFGIVFGLAFTSNHNRFIDLDNPKQTISYYEDTPQQTKWNVVGADPTQAWFPDATKVDLNNQTNKQQKYDYGALVIDGASHQVLDKSFNQSGYQGLVDWIWTDNWWNNRQTINNLLPPSTSYNASSVGSANGVKPPSDDVNIFWQVYSRLVESNHKSLVLPGYMHQNALGTFKQKDLVNYSKCGYILLDANTSDDLNIASIIFRADEAAFMTGIAVSQYLNDNFNEYRGNGGLCIGTFGGLAIPSVTIYMGGIEYGVKVYNDNIEQIANYYQQNPQFANGVDWSDPDEHKIHLINLGGMDSYFSNSFSIGDGKTTVQSLLQYGADAILPVAGPQTIDTVKEIKAQNSNCVVIGVDTAQENDNTINEKSSFKDAAGNQDIIKFSATKNISSITSQILSLSMAKQATNDQTDVQVGTYGYLTVADIRNRGIEPTKNSWPYLLEFIKATTQNTPAPDQDPYDFILAQLQSFPIDDESNIDYFDTDHLSSPEYMQFRV